MDFVIKLLQLNLSNNEEVGNLESYRYAGRNDGK